MAAEHRTEPKSRGCLAAEKRKQEAEAAAAEDTAKICRIRSITGVGVQETKDVARMIFTSPHHLCVIAHEWCIHKDPHSETHKTDFVARLVARFEEFFSLNFNVSIECIWSSPQILGLKQNIDFQCILYFSTARHFSVNVAQLNKHTREAIARLMAVPSVFTEKPTAPGGQRIVMKNFVWNTLFGSYVHPKILVYAYTATLLCGPCACPSLVERMAQNILSAIRKLDHRKVAQLSELTDLLQRGTFDGQTLYQLVSDACDEIELGMMDREITDAPEKSVNLKPRVIETRIGVKRSREEASISDEETETKRPKIAHVPKRPVRRPF